MSVVIWCLPRDILHSLYSEWLRWKDLSRLDLACVEKRVREEWLTSLTDLRILKGFGTVLNNKLKLFYKWLLSRKVFYVEEFPICLDFLKDFVTVLVMESYCPELRSIQIVSWAINVYSSDISELQRNLFVFLSHCHNLQGVSLCMSDWCSEIVLSMLIETLRENSLVKITLRNIKRHRERKTMTSSLLTKHASSLLDLCIPAIDGVDVAFIFSTLIENQICLRELNISLEGDPSQVMASLISYLSFSGGLLENLTVGCFGSRWLVHAEDLITSVAIFCPKLTCLVISRCNPCSAETLRRLYEQCPHLQDVSIDRGIETNEKRKSVSIDVKGQNEDWAICLAHILRRRQYKQVTLILREDNCYHSLGNLKSMLEPYQIKLDVSTTSETSLISLLQDLPHLNSLYLQFPSYPNQQYTDAVWSAIAEHGKSLIELRIKEFNFYDKQLSELIKTCQLLERLTVYLCGRESLVAISELSNLKMVDLTVAESISEELLDGLLLDEKVKWSTALKEGFIRSYRADFFYSFDYKSRHWVKDCK